jgi:NAD(P) transhydrogenase subunit beta
VLCLVALAIGAGIAAYLGKVVKMTDMPQMVAIYNGMGGGAAALIAAVEFTSAEPPTGVHAVLAMLGAFIGSVAFSGSILAWAKLQGVMKKAVRWPVQNLGNVLHTLVTLGLGIAIVIVGPYPLLVVAFFVMSLILGWRSPARSAARTCPS